MLPDTLEGSIHDLTQNILADYTAGRKYKVCRCTQRLSGRRRIHSAKLD